MGIIRVKHAFKEFTSKCDGKVVLRDFHMNVHKGSIYALMGASGCGKTTLISCIMGTCSLDRGQIEVFGYVAGTNNSKIGYMPQEIALIKEFSVREIIFFFGTILGMRQDKINERYESISRLLELPRGDKLIRNCSGGQQRRVSFALTLVHEPEILILDEPTVGLDPLLRVKIWDHLIYITRTKNVTVLLSTHYIEEARKSTHVGFMRNGSLLAEDTPQNLLEKLEISMLEEAFYKLSQDQEHGNEEPNHIVSPEVADDAGPSRPRKKRLSLAPSNVSKMRALMTKNVIQVIRNPGILLFALLVPLIGIIGLHFSIGGNPRGLVLGIVDEEIRTYKDCLNETLRTTEVVEYDCNLFKISCRFIKEIDDEVAIKKFYTNRDEAFADAKKGHIIGFVYFARNFSEKFIVLKKWEAHRYVKEGIVQVHLDNSDLQIVSFLQRNIIKAYHAFMEKIMLDCGKARKAGNIPMVFETYHGSMYGEFKRSIVPGLLIAALFSVAVYLTSIAMIDDRRSGIWLRALTSGVTPQQFLFSHLVVGTGIMILQSIEFIIYTNMVGEDTSRLSCIFLIPLLIFLVGLAGILFGLCISVLTDSIIMATSCSTIAAYPFILVSGIFWPLQGATPVLKYIGYLLPFTLPAQTFSRILYNHPELSSPVVFSGFLVLIGWVIIELIICFWYPSKFNKQQQ